MHTFEVHSRYNEQENMYTFTCPEMEGFSLKCNQDEPFYDIAVKNLDLYAINVINNIDNEDTLRFREFIKSREDIRINLIKMRD